MKTNLVDRPKWGTLCQQINQDSRGALVTIQRVSSDGSREGVAQDLPLRQVLLDEQSNPCNHLLVIEVGKADQKPLRHVIAEPIHLRLKDGDNSNNRYNCLEIQAEDGLTILQINPGLKPVGAAQPQQ